MLPFGDRPLEITTVGARETVVGPLSSADPDVDPEVVIRPVSADGPGEFEAPLPDSDCLVIDAESTGEAGIDVLNAAVEDAHERPIVLVVEAGDEEAIERAVSVGVTETLPRWLLTDEPGLLVERLVTISRRAMVRRGYRELYDLAPGTIALHDPDSGELLHANETLADLLGRDRDELLSKSIEEVTADVPGFDHERARRTVSRARDEEESPELEWPFVTTDGETRWVEVEFVSGTIGDRDVVVSLSTGVAERRRRDPEYAQIFDAVSDAIAVHDPGNEEILEVNAAFCDLTGYSRESLLEVGIDGFSVTQEGHTSERAYEVQRQVMATRSDETVEWKIETASGDHRLAEVTLTPATIGGEDRVVALARDVTEERRRERGIRALQDATERMQEATTAKAIADVAIRAVTDALDLPLAMCWFDDGDGLEPITATDAVHEAGLWSGLERDRYEYEVFENGTVTTYSPRERAPDNPLETAVLLPLGEHGLIAAGRFEGTTYDEVTLDLARALAGHTTTALDRVERAREVRKSERRLRIIADRIDEVIFLSEPDFSELFYVNAAYEEIWGEPIEELYADPRGFIDYIDPRDREEFETDFEAMLADIEDGNAEDRYVFEYRIRTATDDVRWVRATGYPVEVDEVGGDPETRFVGVVEDITERRELERTYRGVFENVSDGLVVHDPESGEMLDVNQRFCEMNGYEREELVGETIDVVTGPDHAYDAAQDMIEAARDEGPQLFEWRNQRKDGETFPVEVHLSVVSIRGEERVLASVRDITERKRREREYQQIFDGVHDAIAVFDPETGEITDVNETYYDLLGYDDLERIRELGIEGLSVTEEGYTGKRGKAIIREVAETGEPETVEWRGETKEGERIWLEATLAPAEIGGEDRVLSLQRDVTERRRREREYERIFNGVNDAITVHDPETAELLDVNDTFCELLDYDRDEILEMGIEGYTPTDRGLTREQAREFVRRVVETGEPRQTEWAVETRDGEIRWLEVEGTTVEIGGERRYVSINRDVTERRRREREYEQIFNGVNEAIAIQDPETAEPVDVNQAFLDRLGYDDVETIREKGFNELSAADAGFTKERAQELCQQVMETGEAVTVEWQQETKEGDRRWIEAKVDSAVIRGEDRILSMQRDVTERKRREQMVRALHESTDDLHAADSRREVCDAAVRAASDVLDLSSPTCWLEDIDGSDALTIAASAENESAGPSGSGLPNAVDPGDVEYTVYESGETSVYDPSEHHEGADSENAVLIALEGHGLFGAIAPTEAGFDDVALDLANILARHVTSALDRVERARELRESERRFRLIAEHIDEIVYLATGDFSEILYINPAYEEVYGRPVEELSENPTSFVDVAHPEDRERYRADVERLISDIEAGDPRDSYEAEYRIQRGGETRWVTVTRFPVENEDGTVDRIVGRVQDVTERRRREREYEQIFNGVTDAITIHDPETGELLDLNETMCALTGYDREELLANGQALYNVPEEGYSTERARENVREVMDAGEPRTTEWLIERNDGERRWVEVNSAPATINGEARNVAMIRDVTEQRRTKRRLSEILDRIDEAIFLTRAEEITQASESPDYVSSGYEEIWGRSLAEIREHHEDGFFGTLHPDDKADYRAFMDRIFAEITNDDPEDRYSLEYRIQRPDGERRWVQSDYYPLEWDGGAPRIVIVSRDITERKNRERRVASFEEATDDLATADDPEQAARLAVTAATDTLDLSTVGAFLYDEDDGVLRSEVRSEDLADLFERTAIEPGEHPLWSAFATGTVAKPSDAPPDRRETGRTAARFDPEELEDWRGIGLGNHGVLFVGTRDATLDSDTVQSAHLLAATLEAALNHVRGRKQLAVREEELRSQTERAERLDRIARITQQVEAAINEASGPTEVSRAVCERLAATGPYEAAWIAGASVGTDRLTARAAVGTPQRYIEDLDLRTTSDAADTHPAVAAWRAEDVSVIDSLVEAGATGEWRQRALAEGFQSLCAVPLTHDGITHGVLTVAATSPNAFADREREVLAQLGASIGYAFAAIERRRTLESDETIELEFTGTRPDLTFAHVAYELGCQVRHERTVPREDGAVSIYYRIDGSLPEDAASIVARTVPGAVDVVTEEAETLLIEVITDTWFGSPLAEYGAVLREATATPKTASIVVEVSAGADIRSLTDRLQRLAPELELAAKRQRRRTDRTPEEVREEIDAILTDRQYEALRTALSAGYFEWPRESDSNEVADRLGITQPTLNKHLRLAEKRTFEFLFDEAADHFTRE